MSYGTKATPDTIAPQSSAVKWLFDPAADHIQLTLERFFVHALELEIRICSIWRVAFALSPSTDMLTGT
jgi:uncharacterized membrane protein